jgi:hypothetical protein
MVGGVLGGAEPPTLESSSTAGGVLGASEGGTGENAAGAGVPGADE